MHLLHQSVFLIALFQGLHIAALTSLTKLDVCISGDKTYATSLPACTKLASSESKCFALPGPTGVDTPAFKKCICNQNFFNLIFNCESETRLCLESDEADGNAQLAAKNWHTECDTFINFKPTTPVLSRPVTFTNEICSSIETVCKIGGDMTSICKQEYGQFITDLPAQPKLENCLCQPDILSMASACLYDGNITCRGIPAKLSNIDLWTACPTSARPPSSPVAAVITKSARLPRRTRHAYDND